MKHVVVSISRFTIRRVEPHRLASKIIDRLLTYNIDVSHELSLSKYNYKPANQFINHKAMHEPIMFHYAFLG